VLLTRAVLVAGAALVAVGTAASVGSGPGAPGPEGSASVPGDPAPPATPAPSDGRIRSESGSEPDPGPGPRPGSGLSTVPSPAPAPGVQIESAAGVPSGEESRTAPPERIRYPRLGAELPIRPTGVTADGQMEIPADAAEAAWYRYGPAPGAGAGSAVIAAHSGSDATPDGPLYAIRSARAGDEVTVTDQDGTAHVYEVISVQRLGKAGLDFSPYFTRTGPERLVLITCGGQWLAERGSYADNIVVVAEPAR
jgi:hypothetical protein